MIKNALTILSICVALPAAALPLGNPVEPTFIRQNAGWKNDCCMQPSWCSLLDQLNWGLGFYGHYVFDRKLTVDGENTNNTELFSSRLNTNGIYLSANWCNRVEVFGMVGKSSFDIEGLFYKTADKVPHEIALRNKSRLAEGLGVRAILLENCGFTLGLSTQYFYCPFYLDRAVWEWEYQSTGGDGEVKFNKQVPTKYREWQWGLGVSYSYACGCEGSIIPYIGYKWSKASFTTNNYTYQGTNGFFKLNNLKNAHSSGYVVGLTWKFGDSMFISIERSGVDEDALSINSQICF